MNIRIIIATLLAATLPAQEIVTVGGYGEAYLVSHSHDGSDNGVARLIIEPVIALGEKAQIRGHIGIERPAENGSLAEAELEAIQLETFLSDSTMLILGKTHMPIGMYNLYHEPIYYLTLEPSRVEGLVVPAEWHETAALVNHTQGRLTLTAGAITPMDTAKMERGTWIREGKESYLTGGKRPGWVVRADYGSIESTLVGMSAASIPLIGTDTHATLVEAHASGRWANGWEANFLAAKGWIGDAAQVNALTASAISKTAEGISLTVGYDVGRFAQLPNRTVVTFAHSEYAVPSSPLTQAGLGGTAHAAGIDWFITPHIVAKSEFRHSNHEGDRFGIGMGFVY